MVGDVSKIKVCRKNTDLLAKFLHYIETHTTEESLQELKRIHDREDFYATERSRLLIFNDIATQNSKELIKQEVKDKNG